MKIGEICETMEPPTLDVSGYHRIMCHHRLDELRQLHSILPADSPILSTPPETAGSASFRA
jgi:hypothetical protein